METLPQHSKTACTRYLQHISEYLCEYPGPVMYQTFPVARVTFVARLRDAINGTIKYNWFGFTAQQLEQLQQAVVKPIIGGVLLGTGDAIKQALINITQKGKAFTTTTTTNANEIEVTLSGLVSVAALIHFQSLNPQPIFVCRSAIPEQTLTELRQSYTNLTIIKDDQQPDTYRLI